MAGTSGPNDLLLSQCSFPPSFSSFSPCRLCCSLLSSVFKLCVGCDVQLSENHQITPTQCHSLNMAKAQTMGMKSSSTHSSIHRNPARLQGPKHASKASKHVSKAFKHAGKVHKSRARPTPKYDGKFEGFDQDDGDYSDDSNNDEAVDDSEAAEDSDDNDASDASNDSNVGGQNAADLYLADEHKVSLTNRARTRKLSRYSLRSVDFQSTTPTMTTMNRLSTTPTNLTAAVLRGPWKN